MVTKILAYNDNDFEGQLMQDMAQCTNMDCMLSLGTMQRVNQQASFQDLPLVLTIDDLMQVLSIGRNTAYGLIRSGQIRSIRVGKQIRIPRDAVEDFLKN